MDEAEGRTNPKTRGGRRRNEGREKDKKELNFLAKSQPRRRHDLQRKTPQKAALPVDFSPSSAKISPKRVSPGMLAPKSILKIDVPVGESSSREKVSRDVSRDLRTGGLLARGCAGFERGLGSLIVYFLMSFLGALAQTVSPVPTASYTATVSGMSTTQNNATVTVASTAGLTVGMAVSGPGIPANTVITSIVNGTQFTISANATANGTGQQLTYSAPPTNLALSASWPFGGFPRATDTVALGQGLSALGLSSVQLGTMNVAGLSVGPLQGPIVLSSGTLTLGAAGLDMAAANASVTVNGAVMNLWENQTWNVGAGREFAMMSGGALTGTGVITLNMAGFADPIAGPGMVTLANGNAGFGGTFTLREGVLRYISNGGAFGSGAINLEGGRLFTNQDFSLRLSSISAGSTAVVDTVGNVNVTAAMVGDGGVTKLGGNTLSLIVNGPNSTGTFKGALTIGGGSVQLVTASGANALSAGNDLRFIDAPVATGVGSAVGQLRLLMTTTGHLFSPTNPQETVSQQFGKLSLAGGEAQLLFNNRVNLSTPTSTATAGSNAVVVSDGTQVQVGGLVTGSNIPAGTVVVAILGATGGNTRTLILSNAATASSNAATIAYSFNSTTSPTVTLTDGSSVVSVNSSANIIPGSLVTGAGVPDGTRVVSVNGSLVTLSSPVAGSGTTNGAAAAPVTAITTGSTTATVASATGIRVGSVVSGTGIPAGTRVVAISGTTVTLSQAATVTSSAAVSFTQNMAFTNLNAVTPLSTVGTAGASAVTVGSTEYLETGWLLSGTGIAPGTVITGIDRATNTVTLSQPLTGTVSGGTTNFTKGRQQLLFSTLERPGTGVMNFQPSVSAGVSYGNNAAIRIANQANGFIGAYAYFGGNQFAFYDTARAGTAASGSTTVTGLSTLGLSVGQGVSGAGIPVGTVISSIDSAGTLTLSQPTTGAVTSLNFVGDGLVRAMAYGTDPETVVQGAVATLPAGSLGKHVSLTGALSAQTTGTILSLRSAANLTLAAGATLTIESGGILAAG